MLDNSEIDFIRVTIVQETKKERESHSASSFFRHPLSKHPGLDQHSRIVAGRRPASLPVGPARTCVGRLIDAGRHNGIPAGKSQRSAVFICGESSFRKKGPWPMCEE
jgi:hypothetical protein